MRRMLSKDWTDKMSASIQLSNNPINSEPFPSVILSWSVSAKWLIAAIASSGQIPKVENLGAGVKRIGIKGTCCPTCGRAIN